MKTTIVASTKNIIKYLVGQVCQGLQFVPWVPESQEAPLALAAHWVQESQESQHHLFGPYFQGCPGHLKLQVGQGLHLSLAALTGLWALLVLKIHAHINIYSMFVVRFYIPYSQTVTHVHAHT